MMAKLNWEELQEKRRKGNKALQKIKGERSVIDLSAYKPVEKRTPYRLTNEVQTNEAFGETTCEEDVKGNIWITFRKGNFQILVSPDKKVYVLIKGIY